MKILVSDNEVDIEAESVEVLEWIWQGNHLHIRLARRAPLVGVSPKSTRPAYGLAPNTTVSRKFDGVTPGMEQK